MKQSSIPDDLRARREYFEARTGRRIICRREFLADLQEAVAARRAFAAGRIGNAEQFWMYYPILLAERSGKTKRRVFEKHLRFYGFSQAGIFPACPEFYLRYNEFYLKHVGNLDCLGLILDRVMTPSLVNYYDPSSKPIYYRDLVPDRSLPSVRENCYLHLFGGKKLLLICPFAQFLQSRANQETFELVWQKTGKKWFHPSRVEALEFPYGFDRATSRRYPTALELFGTIAAGINQHDFDIALVAAAGLAIPIVSHIKSLGKIAISFGGDLQILFGVLGNRWRNWPRWQRDYFNEYWVNLPEKYRPAESDVCDGGAYW
jgi:hypothetical protein